MKNRLRVLRAERDWSQGDLAERLQVSRQSVNAIETGKYDPSLPLAFKLAKLFGTSIETIFWDEPDDLAPNLTALPAHGTLREFCPHCNPPAHSLELRLIHRQSGSNREMPEKLGFGNLPGPPFGSKGIAERADAQRWVRHRALHRCFSARSNFVKNAKMAQVTTS
jgi:putative transcriptional regulator